MAKLCRSHRAGYIFDWILAIIFDGGWSSSLYEAQDCPKCRRKRARGRLRRVR